MSSTAPLATPAPAPATSAQTLLRAERLGKYYAMGATKLRVVQDCSLSLAPREFVAIMGKSGSGKSTLLHLLGALDVPQDGQVYFQGQPVFAPPASRRMRVGVSDVLSAAEKHRCWLRRTQFGFVFQFYHLLPELNVLENVTLPAMIDTPMLRWLKARAKVRDAARELLRRVGLETRIRHRPTELSGGERQRVAIARALVHRPKVLFADEPTGNLDAESGATILEILRGLHADGQSIVMVTHDPGVAAAADRTLRLENGRLV